MFNDSSCLTCYPLNISHWGAVLESSTLAASLYTNHGSFIRWFIWILYADGNWSGQFDLFKAFEVLLFGPRRRRLSCLSFFYYLVNFSVYILGLCPSKQYRLWHNINKITLVSTEMLFINFHQTSSFSHGSWEKKV